MSVPRPNARRKWAATAACGTLLAIALPPLAHAATTNPDPGALETANAALSKQTATEGMVLLENHDRALPMPTHLRLRRPRLLLSQPLRRRCQ